VRSLWPRSQVTSCGWVCLVFFVGLVGRPRNGISPLSALSECCDGGLKLVVGCVLGWGVRKKVWEIGWCVVVFVWWV